MGAHTRIRIAKISDLDEAGKRRLREFAELAGGPRGGVVEIVFAYSFDRRWHARVIAPHGQALSNFLHPARTGVDRLDDLLMLLASAGVQDAQLRFEKLLLADLPLSGLTPPPDWVE